MRRIYHPYDVWEDWQHGMYAIDISGAQARVELARELLASSSPLRVAMETVARTWRHAAEVNLTNPNRNRRAWLGQAACCWAHGVPEDLTKLAWHRLTPEQQDAANAVADDVIRQWERRHVLRGSLFDA